MPLPILSWYTLYDKSEYKKKKTVHRKHGFKNI